MKNTKRLIAVVLCLSLALALAACGGEGGGTSGNNNGENTAPKISGVADQAVEAGTEFDALAGVTASDAEDGDLTGMITVKSMPDLAFSNGKVTPDTAGNYELTYSVTDKAGETAEAYATLTVTRQTGEATVLYSIDFSDITPDSHGWTASVGETAQATGELKQGAYVFEIADPGEGDGDVKLSLPGFAVKGGADYTVKVWAKATKDTYAHILARDENAEDWATFGGTYNARITSAIAPYELHFSPAADGSAELLIHMGKITPNPDNPDDTTASDVTVTIDKIELYETTGTLTQTPIYTNDFSVKSIDGAVLQVGDGASGTGTDGDGKAVFQIDSYNVDGGGVWSVKADLGLGGNAIEAGSKYYYKFTVVAANDQGGEIVVESGDASVRANFNGLSLKAGEEVTIENTFTAESSIDVPVIRMQMGLDPAQAAGKSNTITVTNLEFGKMEGDQEVNKTIDSFGVSFEGDSYRWGCSNGTDGDEGTGVGNLYTEGGKLYYRIDQGSTVDYFNKIGINLNLPADSYFTVEVTGKATKNVSCAFFLNAEGKWEPRVNERIDFTTEEQTFSFDTTDPLIVEMPFEVLFQFGSADTEALGEVTVEISNITIYQRSIV